MKKQSYSKLVASVFVSKFKGSVFVAALIGVSAMLVSKQTYAGKLSREKRPLVTPRYLSSFVKLPEHRSVPMQADLLQFRTHPIKVEGLKNINPNVSNLVHSGVRRYEYLFDGQPERRMGAIGRTLRLMVGAHLEFNRRLGRDVFHTAKLSKPNYVDPPRFRSRNTELWVPHDDEFAELGVFQAVDELELRLWAYAHTGYASLSDKKFWRTMDELYQSVPGNEDLEYSREFDPRKFQNGMDYLKQKQAVSLSYVYAVSQRYLVPDKDTRPTKERSISSIPSLVTFDVLEENSSRNR